MNPESVAPIADMTPEARAGSAESRPASDSSVFGFVIMAIMGLLVMWQFDAPKAVLKDHRMAIAAVLSLAAISTLLFLPTKLIGGQTRVGIVIFGLSPLVAALVAGVVLLPDPYQVPVLRGVFLLVVVLLPPTMFYLFIATRKYSLLKEYVGNLARLGLLDERDDITDADWAPSAPMTRFFAEPPKTRLIRSPAIRFCICSIGTPDS